jgi:hypothetical protein
MKICTAGYTKSQDINVAPMKIAEFLDVTPSSLSYLYRLLKRKLAAQFLNIY